MLAIILYNINPITSRGERNKFVQKFPAAELIRYGSIYWWQFAECTRIDGRVEGKGQFIAGSLFVKRCVFWSLLECQFATRCFIKLAFVAIGMEPELENT
jgi:hypothetical protein